MHTAVMPAMLTVQLVVQHRSDMGFSTDGDETQGASRATDLDAAMSTGVEPQELLAVVRLCCSRMRRESSSLRALNRSRAPQAREMVAYAGRDSVMVGQEKLQLLKVMVAVSCAGRVVVRFSLSNLSGAYKGRMSVGGSHQAKAGACA